MPRLQVVDCPMLLVHTLVVFVTATEALSVNIQNAGSTVCSHCVMLNGFFWYVIWRANVLAGRKYGPSPVLN
jgi:hypothetical protein